MERSSQSWIDLSLPLGRHTLPFPGDPPPAVEQVASLEADGFRLLRYGITGHVGTHVDAPAHVMADGATVDQLDPELFVGDAYVVELPGAVAIEPGALEGRVPQGTQRLLIRTWESGASLPTRSYLTPDAARWLVEHSVRLLGTDSFSVDPVDDETLEVHRILLGAGIPILEALDLRALRAGFWYLVALPLRLEGGDGSPVRALARPCQMGSVCV